MSKSKWHELKKQAEAKNSLTPVTIAEETQRLPAGGPVDTPGELNAQRNNLGPKDNQLETDALAPSSSPRP